MNAIFRFKLRNVDPHFMCDKTNAIEYHTFLSIPSIHLSTLHLYLSVHLCAHPFVSLVDFISYSLSFYLYLFMFIYARIHKYMNVFSTYVCTFVCLCNTQGKKQNVDIQGQDTIPQPVFTLYKDAYSYVFLYRTFANNSIFQVACPEHRPNTAKRRAQRSRLSLAAPPDGSRRPGPWLRRVPLY